MRVCVWNKSTLVCCFCGRDNYPTGSWTKGNLLPLNGLCLEHLFSEGKTLLSVWEKSSERDLEEAFSNEMWLCSGFKMLIQCGFCCSLCLHNDAALASSCGQILKLLLFLRSCSYWIQDIASNLCGGKWQPVVLLPLVLNPHTRRILVVKLLLFLWSCCSNWILDSDWSKSCGGGKWFANDAGAASSDLESHLLSLLSFLVICRGLEEHEKDLLSQFVDCGIISCQLVLLVCLVLPLSHNVRCSTLR